MNPLPIHIDEKGRRVRIGVIVWAIDPEEHIRFFLRHNKPFHGHSDEWNMIFGSVEPEEQLLSAASREIFEESGLTVPLESITDLHYSLEYTSRHGATIIHFFATKTDSVEAKITLNEESIGYDWATLDEVRSRVPYEEQVMAFEKIAG